ncbi:MAG TPA: hypothetical protein VE398_25895 [Acidobacteriota bacterium]|nr:hypothetical protein [Acidobacteriota bacterium]
MAERILLTTLFLVLTQVAPASAIDIVTVYTGGAPPAESAGAGNLVDIFNAAARIWEEAYQDEFTLKLYFGWAPLDSAGNHSLVEQGGSPNRETVGIILFDNSGRVSFYLDPTPNQHEEYSRMTQESQDLGGGFINVARVFRNPVGEAAGHVDLLSVALHEIGHALGLCAANPNFIKESAHGFIDIAGRLPFAGTVIPLSANYSGITPHIDPVQVAYGSLMAGISGDERRIPSSVEILANAQISGFQALNLDLLPMSIATSQSPLPPASRGSSGRLGY